MRILHLSSSDIRGGAARSAHNLLRGLREAGGDAAMLVRNKASSDPCVMEAGAPDREALRQEHWASLIDRKLISPHRTALSNTYFSLPIPSRRLADHPEVRRADVLHLHWVSGFLSPQGIGELQAGGRPLVWTLHDQRPFTGGCHFSAGCKGFETGCGVCPQLDFTEPPLTHASLAESLAQIDARGLVIVSPSRWLAEQARRSALFRNARIEVIPYGIDTSVFRPGRAQARQELGLAPGTICLLAGADAAGEERKGLRSLAEAMGLCRPASQEKGGPRSGPRLELAIFGADRPPQGIDVPARWLGRQDNPEDLARWYRASDAFVLPSTEDNLPNTMLEALCCGTPVIAFPAGGIPEVVTSGRNGLLTGALDPAALACAIQRFATDTNLRQQLQSHLGCGSESKYDLASQAQRYLALYAELLPKPVAPHTPGPSKGPFEALRPALLRVARRERRKGRWQKFQRWLRRARVSVPS